MMQLMVKRPQREAVLVVDEEALEAGMRRDCG